MDTASPQWQLSLQSFQELLAVPDKSPECPIVVTDIPAAVFSSEQMNIHSHFCEKWAKDTKTAMTVDSKGADVLPEPHLKAITNRTPPPNADSYSDFRFDLTFTPSETGGECKQDCNSAFSRFATSCSASSRKSPPSHLLTSLNNPHTPNPS